MDIFVHFYLFIEYSSDIHGGWIPSEFGLTMQKDKFLAVAYVNVRLYSGLKQAEQYVYLLSDVLKISCEGEQIYHLECK